MGSVQRLATMVVFGLVALSTILFLYLGDEDSRINAKAELHQEASIERATSNFIALCMQCHGPAGEGFTEPGVAGTGRIGAPLGGVNTSLNQEGINSRGTPVAGGVEGRAEIIHDTIYNGLQNPDGTYRMPAFGGDSGSLTDEQIEELVVMIQHADWNKVYNEAIETSGGYPTPPPPAATPEDGTATEAGDTTDATDATASGASVVVESHDIFFDPTSIEIPADTPVTIELPNLGAAPHNFSIDELGISVDLAAGETGSVEINAPAGEYEFYCNVPGHLEAGMVGTLIVTEGFELEGAAAPAEEGDAAAEEEPADASAEGAGGSVVVESHDIFFEPTSIEIPADTAVMIELPNLGAAPHNFAIDELGISVDLAPGETGSVEINAPAGEYEFYCNVPGHKEAGMVGTLIVTEGFQLEGAAAPTDEGDAPAEEESAADAESEEAAGDEAAESVTVASHDIYFEPAEVTIAADTEIAFVLPNEGAAPHNFSIDELEIDIDQAPGESHEITINAPAGTYEFYCNVPGHREAGMIGTLTVE